MPLPADGTSALAEGAGDGRRIPVQSSSSLSPSPRGAAIRPQKQLQKTNAESAPPALAPSMSSSSARNNNNDDDNEEKVGAARKTVLLTRTIAHDEDKQRFLTPRKVTAGAPPLQRTTAATTTSIRDLKKSLTLDFTSPESAKKTLQTPDVIRFLQLSSPELDKFFSQGVAVVTTPTPTQFLFPKDVTSPQRQYAQGFIDALNQLYQLNGLGPSAAPTLLSPVLTPTKTVPSSWPSTTTTNLAVQQQQPTDNKSVQIQSPTATKTAAGGRDPVKLVSSVIMQMQNSLMGGALVPPVLPQQLHHQHNNNNHYNSDPFVFAGSTTTFASRGFASKRDSLYPQPQGQEMLSSATANLESDRLLNLSNLQQAGSSGFASLQQQHVMSLDRLSTEKFGASRPSSSCSSSSQAQQQQVRPGPSGGGGGGEQETMKLERKRARNRAAATKCRKRKMERIEQLQEEVDGLKVRGQQSDAEAVQLRDSIGRLQQRLDEHRRQGCLLRLAAEANTATNTTTLLLGNEAAKL